MNTLSLLICTDLIIFCKNNYFAGKNRTFKWDRRDNRYVNKHTQESSLIVINFTNATGRGMIREKRNSSRSGKSYFESVKIDILLKNWNSLTRLINEIWTKHLGSLVISMIFFHNKDWRTICWKSMCLHEYKYRFEQALLLCFYLVQFTDDEKDQLRRLPNKDYILKITTLQCKMQSYDYKLNF